MIGIRANRPSTVGMGHLFSHKFPELDDRPTEADSLRVTRRLLIAPALGDTVGAHMRRHMEHGHVPHHVALELYGAAARDAFFDSGGQDREAVLQFVVDERKKRVNLMPETIGRLVAAKYGDSEPEYESELVGRLWNNNALKGITYSVGELRYTGAEVVKLAVMRQHVPFERDLLLLQASQDVVNAHGVVAS